MLTVGTFLSDRYEIVSKIGAGGMSDVYKAKDHILGRFVAVKVLKSEFSEDRNFVSKFRIEAQSAAGLEHPNIVNIYDVGNVTELHYIVMEYVEGITLKTYIEKKGRLSFKESASIAIQVARGIEAAHNKGIIHRDIKPQNIIISTEGKVKVTDFGIAKAASSNTISSDVMGSVHYASPEQARNGFVDGKSDIYSLGIVMYEMITGRVPFDGETTVAVAIQHLQEEMTPPRQYTPDIPVSFEKIILKCTQKNPDRRYQNMAELLGDLRQSLTNPEADFVVIAPLIDNGKTKVISEEDLRQIKDRGITAEEPEEPEIPEVSEEEEEELRKPMHFFRKEKSQDSNEEELYEEEEDDEEDSTLLNPKLDKGITILGIVTAVTILIVSIYLIGSIAGAFRFGGGKNTQNSEPESESSQQTESESEPESESESESTVSDGEAVPMIKIVGMSKEEAEAAVKELGLYMYIRQEVESDSQEGTILTQSIEMGQQVKKGTTVEVTVAVAKQETVEMVEVPSVVGYTDTEAVNLLKSKKLNYRKDYQYSDSVTAGTVISQTPSSGSVEEGTTIVLVISQGQKSVKVPAVVGKSQTDGQKELAVAGLKYAVSSAYDDSVEEGDIIRQSIEAGRAVEPGTTITITVSLGKKVVYYKVNVTVVEENAIGAEFVLTGADGKKVASGTANDLNGSLTVTAKDVESSSGILKVTWTIETEDDDGNIVESTSTESYQVDFEQQ